MSVEGSKLAILRCAVLQINGNLDTPADSTAILTAVITELHSVTRGSDPTHSDSVMRGSDPTHSDSVMRGSDPTHSDSVMRGSDPTHSDAKLQVLLLCAKS